MVSVASALFPNAILSGEDVESPVPGDKEIVDGKRKLDGLRLELLSPKKQYEQGEPIDVTMRYTYSGDRKLAVTVVTYDRGGRIMAFGFTAIDSEGHPVRDPIRNHLGGMCGGLRGSDKLTAQKPYEQKVSINEWLAFDKPGRYTVRADSSIVRLDDYETSWGGPSIPLKSDPLEIEIVPFDGKQRPRQILRLANLLKSDKIEEREKAARDLRFLLDVRCIPWLVQALDDKVGNIVIQATFGLISFPDASPVKAELMKQIDDRQHFIPVDKMWTLISLLTTADLQIEGKPTNGYDKVYQEKSQMWRDRLTQRFKEQLEGLPPQQAAGAIVDAFALGPILPRNDAKAWKRVLENAENLSGDKVGRTIYELEEVFDIPQLIPELKNVVRNEKVSNWLRGAAIVALHRMGDDSFRDMVEQDIASPKPRFTAATHATLKSTRGIGRELLRIVNSKDLESAERENAAKRLRDIDHDATAEVMANAIKKLTDDDSAILQPLLEALAIKSPRTALPFIRDTLHANRPQDNWCRDSAIRLACRINMTESLAVVKELLHSKEAEDRSRVAYELGSTWREAQQMEESENEKEKPGRQRQMPPTKAVAGIFVPDLLKLYRSDPSGQVRAAARDALVNITGIPKAFSNNATREEEAPWVPQWEKWWKANRPRYQRPKP